MFALTAPRPLIGRIVPDEGAARWAVNAALVVAGSFLLWVSAKIQVPFYPVPMTMQTLAIMAIAATYGMRLGIATVLLYLAEGAFGLPVFAYGGGVAYFFGPSGGFLVGFVVAMVLVGWFAERGADKHIVQLFTTMLIADALLFAIGFAWLAYFANVGTSGTGIGASAAFAKGIAPFILGDLIKIALAASAVVAGQRILRRH
jgi:biotin transport system substrate-specific component